MTAMSSSFPASVYYCERIPELEEIDVMRLTSDLHFESQTRPENDALASGDTYCAPTTADSERAGWTEMVIPGNRSDSRVFPVAGTSLEYAPRSRFSGFYRSEPADGLSLQAIKR